jgi:hypothetical protein
MGRRGKPPSGGVEEGETPASQVQMSDTSIREREACESAMASAAAHLSGRGGPDATRDRLEAAVNHLAGCRTCRASLEPGERARFVFEVSLSRP